MKICKSCKYYSVGDCTHPATNAKISPVTGEPIYVSAWYERAENGSCGPEAIRYDAKSTEIKEVA